jgi:hypothetical protein
VVIGSRPYGVQQIDENKNPVDGVGLFAAALLLVVSGCQQATRPSSLSSTRRAPPRGTTM